MRCRSLAGRAAYTSTMSHDSDPFQPVVRNLEDGKMSKKDTGISRIPRIIKEWKDWSKCNVTLLHTSVELLFIYYKFIIFI
jgi:hypothetical protein